jgi:uncharacterized membrane protein
MRNTSSSKCSLHHRNRLQPILIPSLLACFVTAFVCDFASWLTGNPFWSIGARWFQGIGVVVAALAVVVGLIDLLGEQSRRTLKDGWYYVSGNVLVIAISLYNLYLRYTSGQVPVMPSALILSLIVVCILLFTGWKGMELVYRRRFDGADF